MRLGIGGLFIASEVRRPYRESRARPYIGIALSYRLYCTAWPLSNARFSTSQGLDLMRFRRWHCLYPTLRISPIIHPRRWPSFHEPLFNGVESLMREDTTASFFRFMSIFTYGAIGGSATPYAYGVDISWLASNRWSPLSSIRQFWWHQSLGGAGC